MTLGSIRSLWEKQNICLIFLFQQTRNLYVIVSGYRVLINFESLSIFFIKVLSLFEGAYLLFYSYANFKVVTTFDEQHYTFKIDVFTQYAKIIDFLVAWNVVKVLFNEVLGPIENGQ